MNGIEKIHRSSFSVPNMQVKIRTSGLDEMSAKAEQKWENESGKPNQLFVECAKNVSESPATTNTANAEFSVRFETTRKSTAYVATKNSN